MPDWPKITVITPSYNQAKYLERTIRSVLDQGYPNLEYFIIDGGSTDGSVDIIRRYESQLAYWISEPDKGQTDAINKGLRRATGDWVGWQNSDDVYFPHAFEELAHAAKKHPDVELIIGNMMLIDEHDQPLRDICYVKPTYRALLAEGMLLANQSSFWRRSLQVQIGLLDESLICSFDYDWFLRLCRFSRAVHVNKIWGALRLHGDTKTSLQTNRFMEENQRILEGRKMSAPLKTLYKLRRLCLLLAQGKVAYVARGIARRSSGRGGELT